MSHLALPWDLLAFVPGAMSPRASLGPPAAASGCIAEGFLQASLGREKRRVTERRNTEPPGGIFLFQKHVLLPAWGFLVCIP